MENPTQNKAIHAQGDINATDKAHIAKLHANSPLNKVFTQHASHLSDSEVSNGLEKYFKQRKKRN